MIITTTQLVRHRMAKRARNKAPRTPSVVAAELAQTRRDILALQAEGEEINQQLTALEQQYPSLKKKEEEKIPNITEELALILAFDEARKQLEPRGWWPSDGDALIQFAGRDFTQADLADLIFEKYKRLLIAEAFQILLTRAAQPPLGQITGLTSSPSDPFVFKEKEK